MRDVVRSWFRPRSGSASELASKFLAAGHIHVAVHADLAGMVPFEPVVRNERWRRRVQAHFECVWVRDDWES